MSRKLLIRVVLLLAVIAMGVGVWQLASATPTPAFRFVTVERGDIQAVVSATGTLNAVTTVNVGTQVSGQVSALYADFNDQVKKGQLLARIDPTIAQQAVADAQANLERLRAHTNQAARDQDRNRELSADGLIPTSQTEQGEAALKVAQASEKSAAIALSRAQQGLSYTSIYAPIDGVVVERNVNLGQTVAASLQAPQLFLIANDLTQMRILAQVGESDIDKIEEGQATKFTVQALPDRTFTGAVEQVRLQSTMVDNVVNYTVVVKVENPKHELLPGMTARVDFLVKASTGVLKISNAALRFKPSEEVLAQMGASPAPAGSPRGQNRAAGAAGEGSPGPNAGAPRRDARNGGGSGGGGGGGRAATTLYVLDASGKIEAMRVQTGLTDGTSTEIQGRNVVEGMKVIAGVLSASAAARPAANPLAPQQNRRGPGGGPF